MLLVALFATNARAGEPVGPGIPAIPVQQSSTQQSPEAPATAFEDGIPESVLAFYKTLSYTAVVLTTDQIPTRSGTWSPPPRPPPPAGSSAW